MSIYTLTVETNMKLENELVIGEDIEIGDFYDIYDVKLLKVEKV